MFAVDDLRIFTEPQQGATYGELLAVARRAEKLGFGAFFRSDHYLAMGGALEDGGLPGPTDAWTTLAGLARETSRLRLGTMMTAATFRLPGVLAITVANVDEMSGGRVELGIGTGWYQQEHAAYGVPFPATGERFDRLTEQLEVISGLWSTPERSSFSYSGSHYRLVDSPALPKPVQDGGVPIIIGGVGPARTPQLAARFAAEFNVPFRDIDKFRELRAAVTAACESIGRNPASLVYSAALVVAIGATHEEFTRRAAAIGREPDELRSNGIAGTIGEAIESMNRWQQAGAQRLYLQVLDLSDLDHLDAIAEMTR